MQEFQLYAAGVPGGILAFPVMAAGAGELCCTGGGLVDRISKLLEFLVDFSPFLGGLLMDRDSKMLEFLVDFSH